MPLKKPKKVVIPPLPTPDTASRQAKEVEALLEKLRKRRDQAVNNSKTK